MQPGGGDADLGAEAEFAAIAEAGGGVDHHHGGADRLHEALRGGLVGGGDDFGVVGAVAADVGDAGVEVVDHAHGEDQVEELGGVVVVGRRVHVGYQGAAAFVAAQFDAALTQCLRGAWQERIGHVAMHQQRLQRVAHAGARGLAVDQQVQRQVEVGGAVHVQVADALVVLDHRHARVFGDEADQAFAAARDGQVDDVDKLQQLDHRLAAEILQHRHRGLRHAVRAQRGMQCRGDGEVGMDRLGAAAQDHAIAGHQAQRRGVGGDVGARLVDHRDHAERDAHALDRQAIRPRLAAGRHADRIGQFGHFAQRAGDAGHARLVQPQPVEHGALHALRRGLAHVLGVGGQHRGGLRFQRRGHVAQQRTLRLAAQRRHDPGGVAASQCLFADRAHALISCPDATGRFMPTRSSRCTTSSP